MEQINFDDLGTPTSGSGTPEIGGSGTSTPTSGAGSFPNPDNPMSPVIELDAEAEGPSDTQATRGGRPPLPRRQSNRSKAWDHFTRLPIGGELEADPLRILLDES
ncbi:hypothetical protein CJ030_MR1G005680 [Morella rubra]|uniref:Uncharacterized protein n=1 Tax=Morella rubra TaxID=262757 RepID=A0A6A1W8T0_9ROSI|nr:hypothetical protein CJ030_MR3G005585 [Morella rubra]KAB1225140.1 hypothetical protein CJ030_MR1G005680 [Morella rubra]